MSLSDDAEYAQGRISEIRLPDTPPIRVQELQIQQQQVFDHVPRPPGASDVSLHPGATQATLPDVYIPAPDVGQHAIKPFQLTGYTGVGVGATQPSGAR